MVTFDNGDLVLRVPNMGNFDSYLSINAALFEAYDYAIRVVMYSDGLNSDCSILHLRCLSEAMNRFEGKTMFKVTEAIEAATAREEAQA